ncbi:MAG: dethiobiotin synthase [Legionella sp.]|nr:dethiobiotin synthase [Legionella sp.]
MKRYFITGTDTDCGKTYVTSALLNYFANTVAIKPVASGSADDALALQQNNSISLSLSEINPWVFKLPVSPHIAADQEEKSISVKELSAYCRKLHWPGIETLFIEGAGGLMVPLNQKETWVDFLKDLGCPVIVVVGMKLGCINHALLTQTALQTANIPFAGWVANCLYPSMDFLDENIATLKNKLQAPLLSVLKYQGKFTSVHLD